MHKFISPDSAIDPLVTSLLGRRCKRTSVSRLVVTLHSLYRRRLFAEHHMLVVVQYMTVS